MANGQWLKAKLYKYIYRYASYFRPSELYYQ